jgi:hypothetical protein
LRVCAWDARSPASRAASAPGPRKAGSGSRRWRLADDNVEKGMASHSLSHLDLLRVRLRVNLVAQSHGHLEPRFVHARQRDVQSSLLFPVEGLRGCNTVLPLCKDGVCSAALVGGRPACAMVHACVRTCSVRRGAEQTRYSYAGFIPCVVSGISASSVGGGSCSVGVGARGDLRAV